MTPQPGQQLLFQVHRFQVALPTAMLLYALSSAAMVFGYSIDWTNGALSPINGSPFTLSSAIDYFAIDPPSQFVYAASENAGTVARYNIDPSSGALTAVAAPSVLSPGVTLLTVVKPSQ